MQRVALQTIENKKIIDFIKREAAQIFDENDDRTINEFLLLWLKISKTQSR